MHGQARGVHGLVGLLAPAEDIGHAEALDLFLSHTDSHTIRVLRVKAQITKWMGQ